MGDTGINTASDRQAIITVMESCLISRAFAEALQAAIKIELPASLNNQGQADFFTSSAINQLVAQILPSADFQNLLTIQINSPQFISNIAPAIAQSTEFSNVVDQAVSDSFNEDTNLQRAFNYTIDSVHLPVLASALLNNDQFIINLVGELISNSTYINDINNRITAAVSTSSPVLSTTAVLDVSMQATFTFDTATFPGGVPTPYIFTPNFSGIDSTGFTEVSRTGTSITYEFPNALAGETVSVNYFIVSN